MCTSRMCTASLQTMGTLVTPLEDIILHNQLFLLRDRVRLSKLAHDEAATVPGISCFMGIGFGLPSIEKHLDNQLPAVW